jgi:Ca2+-binding RTX toxin-like protein
MFSGFSFDPNNGGPRFGNRGGGFPGGGFFGGGFRDGGFRDGGRLGGLLTPEELMNLTSIEGTENNDNLIGTPGGDRIEGRVGDDVLTGGDGNDLISGGGRPRRFRGFFADTDPNRVDPTDNDFLSGDNGNDTLIGGFGNDTFTGGLGEDTFIIKSGCDDNNTTPGQHVITDFQLGQDELLLPSRVATEANLPISDGAVGTDPSMFGLVEVDLSGVPPVIALPDGSSISINYV